MSESLSISTAMFPKILLWISGTTLWLLGTSADLIKTLEIEMTTFQNYSLEKHMFLNVFIGNCLFYFQTNPINAKH